MVAVAAAQVALVDQVVQGAHAAVVVVAAVAPLVLSGAPVVLHARVVSRSVRSATNTRQCRLQVSLVA